MTEEHLNLARVTISLNFMTAIEQALKDGLMLKNNFELLEEYIDHLIDECADKPQTDRERVLLCKLKKYINARLGDVITNLNIVKHTGGEYLGLNTQKEYKLQITGLNNE